MRWRMRIGDRIGYRVCDVTWTLIGMKFGYLMRSFTSIRVV
jgi:hypothetical protein